MSNAKQTIETEVLVLGSGPGGYTAAFRAADLGKKVTLVERYPTLGGVCLNVGCIPSKALLHVAKIIDEAAFMGQHGVKFGAPKIDLKEVRAWKNKVVSQLTGGLAALAKQRKVNVVTGVGKFIDSHHLSVATKDGEDIQVKFENAIIAAGSRSVQLPFMPEDKRIFDSTGALELASAKGKILVLGGGIIGLEMATVYDALGAKVTVVEMCDQIMPGVDPDLVKPLYQRISKRYDGIYLATKVTKVDAKKEGIYVTFEGANAPKKPEKFDQVLVSVGRVPNGKAIDAVNAGVNVDERGFIAVDNQMRTNVPHIFAIGDIVGQPMLAHKAMPEGKIAAEVIAGEKVAFDAVIPSVAYTDPEVAWVGVTETQAKAQNIPYEKGVFPWAANGRSLSLGRNEGMTKLIFHGETKRIIGAGIVGTSAGDLISEAVLAIEMGCDAEDIALSIHPHPTLAESIAQSAEVFEGTVTDLYMPKKKSAKKEKAA